MIDNPKPYPNHHKIAVNKSWHLYKFHARPSGSSKLFFLFSYDYNICCHSLEQRRSFIVNFIEFGLLWFGFVVSLFDHVWNVICILYSNIFDAVCWTDFNLLPAMHSKRPPMIVDGWPVLVVIITIIEKVYNSVSAATNFIGYLSIWHVLIVLHCANVCLFGFCKGFTITHY